MLAKDLENGEWGYAKKALGIKYHRADIYEILFADRPLPKWLEQEILDRRNEYAKTQ